jgi:hypothetical protein
MPDSLSLTRISFSGTPGSLLVIGFSCCAPLLAATTSTWCHPASAQVTTPGLRQPSRIDAASPLSLGSAPRVPQVGIALGSTDIATPGISPAASQPFTGSAVGSTECSSFTNSSQSSGALFDGGGISGGASVSCAPMGGLDVSGPVRFRSSGTRAGIPLGSTELGGAGLSAVAPVPGPLGMPRVSSPATEAPPCQAVSASSPVSSGSGGC